MNGNWGTPPSQVPNISGLSGVPTAEPNPGHMGTSAPNAQDFGTPTSTGSGMKPRTDWIDDGEEPDGATGFTTGTAVTVAIIAVCMITALCQTSLAGNITGNQANGLESLIILAVILTGTFSPLVLLRRNDDPDRTCIKASVVTAVLPIGPLLAVAALASLIARRLPSKRVKSIEAGAVASLIITSVRDALLPGKASFVRYILADSASSATGTAGDDVGATIANTAMTSTSMALLVNMVFCALWIAVAYLVGSNERHRALERTSARESAMQRSKSERLQTALNGQQFADAVAAEAHDTLAHSLSLIALNANMLKMQTDALQQSLAGAEGESATRHADPTAGTFDSDSVSAVHDAHTPEPDSDDPRELAASIGIAAENLRRQAAGALDEVHGIISMLRDPQSHADLLGPGSDTSLTYESLNSLVDDARSSGMPLDSWIDVRDVTAVDPAIGKLAYRIVQEGLTNAQRHAPGQRVSLAVSCNRAQGIVIHFSNPCLPQQDEQHITPGPSNILHQSTQQEGSHPQSTQQPKPDGASGGNGLPGLKQRVDDVGGTITWSVDWRAIFHLDATLPLTPLLTHSEKPRNPGF